jgi:hypothetical protein
MFPLGLLVWGLMYILALREPGLRLSHEMDSRTGIAQRFQARFDRVERVQIAMFNNLASASRENRQSLEPVREEIDRITEQTYQLCKQITALENLRLVDKMKQARQESDLMELDRKIAEATDPVVRQDYEEARRAMQNRLEKMKEITLFLDRVDAQLASLASTLDNMLTEAIHLQALGSQQVRANVPQLLNMIREQKEQLTIFDAQASAF